MQRRGRPSRNYRQKSICQSPWLFHRGSAMIPPDVPCARAWDFSRVQCNARWRPFRPRSVVSSLDIRDSQLHDRILGLRTRPDSSPTSYQWRCACTRLPFVARRAFYILGRDATPARTRRWRLPAIVLALESWLAAESPRSAFGTSRLHACSRPTSTVLSRDFVMYFCTRVRSCSYL